MTHDTHGDLDAILNDPGDPLQVLAANWDLLAVLEGREITFATVGGTPVRIRLYNPDELIAAQKTAAEALGGPDPGLTRQKAIELCMPLSEILRQRGYRRTP